MYSENKFFFNLHPEALERNNELRSHFNNVVVSFGGIILPVKSVVPKGTSVDVKSRSWLSKESMGLKTTKNTERINKDGTITIIKETRTSDAQGTRIIETEETTYDPVYDADFFANNPYGTLAEFYDALAIRHRGSHTITVTNNSPKQFPKSTTRTTRTLKQGEDKEEVTEVTRTFDATDNVNGVAVSEVSTKKVVDATQPKVFAKPVLLTSITGKQFAQFIGAYGPKDETWWNEEMRGSGPGTSTEDVRTEVSINGANNTKLTKTFTTRVDAKGNRIKEELSVEEPYVDPVARLEAERDRETTTTSETITQGLTERAFTTVYDKFGNKISETERNVLRTPSVETSSTEEISSEGTKTTRNSTKTIDPQTGEEIVVETETQENTANKTTVTRTDSIDYDSNVKTVTLSKTVTERNGDTRTEEKVVRYPIRTTQRTVEKITEEFEDDIIDKIVQGTFVMEFQFSGELIEDDIARLLMEKNFQHQKAWGMLELLEQQLELGSRIQLPTKKKLYEEYIRILAGNLPVGQEVREGPVLDRIELEVFGEEFQLGCVFAKNDGFKMEWIPGTEKMYSWTLNVQVLNNIIENSHIIDHEDFQINLSTGEKERFNDVFQGDYK